MLAFTEEVTEVLGWFQLTHSLTGGVGWLAWQRTALPTAGGLDVQPARLMEALALVAREENALLTKTKRRRPDQRKKRHASNEANERETD